MKDEQEFFERRIITGLIVSTDYLERVQDIWDPTLLESPELRLIAGWCLEYFHEYGEAPDEDIEAIYMERLKTDNLPQADAEYLEALLADLSHEYGRGSQFNSAYLYDQTVEYLKARELEHHQEEVQYLLDEGKTDEAEQLAESFTPSVLKVKETGLDLSSEEALDAVERAFSETSEPVITYPGALGQIWNEHLTRGGFFTLLAPEKRGKTFMLIELSLRAIRQRANVAFFAAGDMTRDQMLKRICIYIARRSDKKKYCQERFKPVGDCVFNQLDICSRPDRNCDHGVFDRVSLSQFNTDTDKYINIEVLKNKYQDNTHYEPCDSHTCDERRGSVWLEKVEETRPLTAHQAKKLVKRFFERYKRRFKLITYPADTLTVTGMRRCLDDWEKHDGFVPDVIAVDYADLLSADDGEARQFRHRQDHVWKNLRALSQERHALVLSATQADARSYERGRLTMSNFSEDKRKMAHVTAQYGLNQDPKDREKKLGILRVNEIVVREGEFSADHEVHVLQDLAAGRPFLESY